MNDIIRDIGEFVFVEDKPQVCDAIMVIGGSHPEQGEMAAKLWKEKYAPRCIIGGGVSIKTGKFPGPKSKTEIYNGDYKTEYDFFKDVLIKNGVPESAIIGEDKSSFTRENAEFARKVCDEEGLVIKKAILVCKAFHSRRCLMFYQTAFPDTEFLICPVDGYNITKDNWYKSEYGVKRVLGELKRYGDQFDMTDIQMWQRIQNK